MKILSHRGYWIDPAEKNKEIAFERSFSLGFGTETDIRDCLGQLVISHDIPMGEEMKLERFFQIYNSFQNDFPLALNVKSDGFQSLIRPMLGKYGIENYFLFDMSIPDAVVTSREGLKFFTRQSEYEIECALYEESCGVWMDEFYSSWIENHNIETHLNSNKKVCIVSPDLHKRDYENKWQQYKTMRSHNLNENIMICTDFPELLRDFLNEKD